MQMMSFSVLRCSTASWSQKYEQIRWIRSEERNKKAIWRLDFQSPEIDYRGWQVGVNYHEHLLNFRWGEFHAKKLSEGILQEQRNLEDIQAQISSCVHFIKDDAQQLQYINTEWVKEAKMKKEKQCTSIRSGERKSGKLFSTVATTSDTSDFIFANSSKYLEALPN